MPGPGSFPAEWEQHRATWLAWPHNVRDWPGKFGPIPWVYAEIVRRIAEGETVRILAGDVEARARAVLAKAGVELRNVEFLRIPTDRVWTRDSGPIFLEPGVIAHFRFNAWAKYPDFKKDARIPERAAKAKGYELRDVGGAVLEGGAIDVNGAGDILVTEECLLDPSVQVRNPGFSRSDYEKLFAGVLGARNTIWLGRGIAGDDTHGHIDDLARFVGPRTIVLCSEKNASDPNHRLLEENRERLQSARLADGSRPEVVALPMPQPVVFGGQRLPASYANFYVCNAAVLVPVFDDPGDVKALGLLGELLKRPAIGIHARDLVWGLGTLHCLSQQEPA
ncbi:MAG: agmatine deiminase family protein [Myxococcales bacterium]